MPKAHVLLTEDLLSQQRKSEYTSGIFIRVLTKVYLLCAVFIWVRATLPRLRSDQLMQFAWLILMPATLGNILLTGLLYLVVSGLGGSTLVFLLVVRVINWGLFFGLIRIVGSATAATTRRAQSPALRVRMRQETLAQIPEQLELAGKTKLVK